MRFRQIETLDIRNVTNMLGRDVYVAVPDGSETLVLANSEDEATISRSQRLAWGFVLYYNEQRPHLALQGLPPRHRLLQGAA